MASLNKVILLGRLGADPELRETGGGTKVCEFRIATNERWRDGQGQNQERTDWHRIVVWGRQAELAAQYLSKGRQVLLEGRIQTRDYQDKDGQKRYVTEIVANNVTFLDDRGATGGRGGADVPPPDERDQGPSFDDDEIPF